VKPAPNFTIADNPGSLAINQLDTGTSKVTITPENGFTGNVTLAVSGLPKGVNAFFSANPTTSTSTLTLEASAAAATGTSTLTITGTSGSLTHTTTLKLTVNPGLTLTASPNRLTITHGNTGATTILIAPQKSLVTLSVSGLPSGVKASFSPNPAINNSALMFTVSGTAATGTFTITVTGTEEGLTATTKITLTVR
jgi:hypothetical protein